MPSATLNPPSPLEHLKDRLDVPRTPSPGQCCASQPATRARALTTIATDTAHGIIKQDDLGYRTARFAGKDTHKAAVIDVRFRDLHCSRCNCCRIVPLLTDQPPTTQIVASNGFLPDVLVQSEYV